MGIIYSILELGMGWNPRDFPQQKLQNDDPINYTPIQRWRKSNKSQMDIQTLLQNISSDKWIPQINYFLKSIRNRQSYQLSLKIIIQHVISQKFIPHVQQLNQKRKLYSDYFNRLSNSYFFSLDEEFNQRNIDHVYSKMKMSQKLMNLFIKTKFYNNNAQAFVNNALIANYPEILENLDEFAESIIQREVYIENQFHFLAFILSKQKIQKASQDLRGFKSKFLQHSIYEAKCNFQQKLGNGKNIYFKMISKFMQYDNPQAAEIVFKGLLQGNHQLSQQDLVYYFYIKCYAAYLFELGHVDSSFNQFLKFKIEDIIHIFLTDHGIQTISILKKLFEIWSPRQIQQKEDSNQKINENCFHSKILDYAFSSKCLMNLTIKILQSKQLNLPQKQLEEISQRFIKKLYECGYQIVRMRSKIQFLIQKKMKLKDQMLKNLKTILYIAQILLTFNISNKMNTLTNFFSKNIKPVQILQQGLFLLKTFISKYYISDRNKKIKLYKLNEKGVQIQWNLIQLTQEDSIIKICLYLKQNLFKQNIGNSQIYQMIFQHMLYFYRFQQVKKLLDQKKIYEQDQTYIQKYGIVYEMIQGIILQNIYDTLKKQKIQRVNSDLLIQLDLLKNDNEQKRSVNAFYKLLKYLQKNEIYLTFDQKQNGLNIRLLYWLVDTYKQRLEIFDYSQIYRNICLINEKHISNNDCVLTNEYLHFQVHLAKCAYRQGRNAYGQDIIKQLARYQPPWLSQQLIKIAKSIKNIPQKFLMMAFQHCMKGQDMQYLINLWDKKQFNKGDGRKRDKIKQYSINKINQYFQTTSFYTVLDNQLIYDEKQYRNHIAQMKFTQDKFQNDQNYQMFFKLFGTQTNRAFHYAIKKDLKIDRIQFFLTQGMKGKNTLVFNPFTLVPYYFKYLYFLMKSKISQKQKIVSYEVYKNTQISKLFEEYPKMKKDVLTQQLKNSYIGKHLDKIYQSAFSTQTLGKQFINTYIQKQKIYNFIFEQKSRITSIVDLTQQPLGKSDIKSIKKVCDVIMNIKIIELCIFALSTITNSNLHLNEKAQNIMMKLVVWTENEDIAKAILKNLINKVHSTFMLIKVLNYLRDFSEIDSYRRLVSQDHLEILKSLDAVEVQRQFFGLIPQAFFQKPIQYNPKHQQLLSQKIKQKVLKAAKKWNIFILSKTMSFFYGMNPKIQKQILIEYLTKNPDQQFDELRQKFGLNEFSQEMENKVEENNEIM